MSVERKAPPWLPLLAGLALVAFLGLLLGPERALHLARGVARAPHAQDLLPAAGWSMLRMTASYVASLLFAWLAGYTAATRPRAARLILPLLDVGQSVPVLGFFPAAIYLFVTLLGGGRLSLEMAAIFLIFTSQVWNLAFAVYEGISTIPAETRAAVDSLGVRGVLRMRALLLPACIPPLVYNSILSWANGWYFLIACEIIVTGKAQYDLPGLGSMLSRSLARGDLALATGALVTLVALVVAIELVVWRPVRAWSQRYRYDTQVAEEDAEEPGFRPLALGIPALLRPLRALAHSLWERLPIPALNRAGARVTALLLSAWRWARWPLGLAAVAAVVFGFAGIVHAIRPPWPPEAARLPLALLLSFLRIAAAYVLAMLWIIPVALWASDHPRQVRGLTLIAQIGASVPATAFFPVLVALLVNRFGGMEIISIALAMTGMQWYLLFNLLGGVSRVPSDLRESMRSLGLSRAQVHRQLVLPACMPSLVTGSVVAWGGTWNALILSEYVVYRGQTYEVLGLGQMLNRATFQTGSRSLLFLSVALLVATVVTVNRLVWDPLYRAVSARYRLET
ncbi:MAG TPA: ABC transporter permease subunit [Candidatus Eisenbacteria bacterium]|jgi:NitT/TauT family transport system permease protein